LSKTEELARLFLSRSEIPELVGTLAKQIIQTLEPLIDTFINEKLISIE
jgi:hypothetical protein